ncbi:hypothetical protein BDW75DRAFT_243961 [Aspergillus navahoensis]
MEPITQPASGWNSCPEDIWFLVFKELSSAEHRALCLVNKHCRSIAEPFLYSKIQWTWQEDHIDQSPRFSPLLRTLLSRPQLAAYITTFHLDGNFVFLGWERFRRHLATLPLADDALHQSIEFIHQTGVSYSDIWIEKIRQGSIGALIALFSAQLPNVKCLYLSPDFTRETALIGMVLRSAILEPGSYRLPRFQDLREVTFMCRRAWDEIWEKKNTADVLPLFYPPNLQRMSAYIQNPKEWAWPAAQLPMLLDLTSLDLAIIREGCLGKVLAATPNLETLRWEWLFDWGVWDRVFMTQTIDLNKIAADLSHVRGTLTDLTINAIMGISAPGDAFRPGLKAEGSLHALVDFDMIKRFECRGRFWWDLHKIERNDSAMSFPRTLNISQSLTTWRGKMMIEWREIGLNTSGRTM